MCLISVSIYIADKETPSQETAVLVTSMNTEITSLWFLERYMCEPVIIFIDIS